MNTNPLNDLDAILDGFIDRLKNDQLISDSRAQVLRFDSADTFVSAQDAAREAPGFCFVVGFEGLGNDYPGQVVPPLMRFRAFVVCVHSGLFASEVSPLAAAKLPGNLHATTLQANGRDISIWLTGNALELTATIPCMEYQTNFELIIN